MANYDTSRDHRGRQLVPVNRLRNRPSHSQGVGTSGTGTRGKIVFRSIPSIMKTFTWNGFGTRDDRNKNIFYFESKRNKKIPISFRSETKRTKRNKIKIKNYLFFSSERLLIDI